MDQPAENSEPVSGQWNSVAVTALLLLLAPVAPAVFPAIFVALAIAYLYFVSLVPVWSASTSIADLETNLTLSFYSVWDAGSDSGRYLYVDAPAGRIRIYMTAFDWAHNPRTSVYLTPMRKLAVLGPTGDDHLVSLDPPGAIGLPGPETANRAAGASENWTYLGAFDYVLKPNGAKALRFVDAKAQPECVPMLSNGPYMDYTVRVNARQRNCQHPYDGDPGKP